MYESFPLLEFVHYNTMNGSSLFKFGIYLMESSLMEEEGEEEKVEEEGSDVRGRRPVRQKTRDHISNLERQR
jgi:hypothetical protein